MAIMMPQGASPSTL